MTSPVDPEWTKFDMARMNAALIKE
jgi:hypothetical protein